MGPIPRPLRGLSTAIVFAAAATTTVWWCASMGSGMRMPGGWTAWMRMSGQSWACAAIGFVAMWALMMISMMLPSLAPVLRTGGRCASRAPISACVYVDHKGELSTICPTSDQSWTLTAHPIDLRL
jgi:predicted metal-binding membrane protein